MKKKLTMLVSMALLLAVLAATPALASPPPSVILTETPFSTSMVEIVTNPGTTYNLIGTLQVTTGIITSGYATSTAWGNTVTCPVTFGRVIDEVTMRGSGQGWPVLNFAKGTLNRLVNMIFDGPGSFKYMGPTFTYTIGTATGTFANGATYSGLLFHGTAVGFGSGGLAGTLEGDTLMGVLIAPGTTNGGTILTYISGYIQTQPLG